MSLATASRALNGSERKVAESYRVKVLAAAASLGYTPNLSAQAVAKGGTNTVALLVADIADPYFSSIAAGVIRASEANGLVVTMAVTGRDSARELELVRALRGQRPRVMILAGSRSSVSDAEDALVAELTAFEHSGGRVVFVSQNKLPFRTVEIDNAEGARLLALSLVELGYRNFAAIAGSDELLTARDRLSGFRAGLAEHDLAIADAHVKTAEFSRDGGFGAANELLAGGIGDVEIVFAVSDVVAIGALSAFREAGLMRDPERSIAVAGFDDIPIVKDVTPSLTTVRIPLEEVGAQALALAFDTETGATVGVSTTVVLRESTPRR